MPDLSNANELLDLNHGRIRIDGGNEITAFLQKVREIAPPDRSILVLLYQPDGLFPVRTPQPYPLELSLAR